MTYPIHPHREDYEHLPPSRRSDSADLRFIDVNSLSEGWDHPLIGRDLCDIVVIIAYGYLSECVSH